MLVDEASQLIDEPIMLVGWIGFLRALLQIRKNNSKNLLAQILNSLFFWLGRLLCWKGRIGFQASIKTLSTCCFQK